jgi:hypothetical protein
MMLLRALIYVWVGLAAITPSPSTRPAATVPPREPDREQLTAQHLQAVEFMRLGRSDKAQEILDHVYQLTPANWRTRALVLNRAIVDVHQRQFAARALRELTEYLKVNKGEDELATDILSGALEVVASDTPKLKNDYLWQTAYKEWDRRNYNLEKGRPGSHHWGARWLTDEEFKQIEAKQAEVKEKVEAQRLVVQSAAAKFDELVNQQANAKNLQAQYQQLRQSLYSQVVQGATPMGTASPSVGTGGPFGTVTVPGNVNLNVPNQFRTVNASDLYLAQFEDAKLRDAAMQQQRVVAKMNVEMREAWAELVKQRLELSNIAAQRPKPQWPTRFEPVDPTAPDPQPSTQPTAAAPADEAAAPQPASSQPAAQ